MSSPCSHRAGEQNKYWMMQVFDPFEICAMKEKTSEFWECVTGGLHPR